MLLRTCVQRNLQWSFWYRKLDRERTKTVKIARRPKKKGAEKARTPACCWCSRFLRPFGFWNTPAPPSQEKKLQRKTWWSEQCNTVVQTRRNCLLLFLVTGARGFGKMQMTLINICVTFPPKKYRLPETNARELPLEHWPESFSKFDGNALGCRFCTQKRSNMWHPESVVSALAGALFWIKGNGKTRPRKPCQRGSLGVFLQKKSAKNAQATALTN